MIKVLMRPHLSEIQNEVGGIAEVIRGYFRFLPQFGVELVDPNATTYDIVAAHAGIVGGACTVAHTHGLYFSANYNAQEWEWHVNSRVIESIRNAKEITVPSEWVNETFRRDLRKAAHVIPHGIVWQEWQHKEECAGFVLYNKTRNADVCDNSVLDILARRFPEVRFVSTLPTPSLSKLPYSDWPTNFKIIETGVKTPHAEMKRYVQRSAVYLALAKETWGIGIAEACASGIPVLGWAWGNVVDLVQHGTSGYLARPGDIDDLCEGLNFCLKYQKILGENGQELSKQWSWEKACEQVARVYEKATVEEEATISVVIPVYNKPKEQLNRAIESALNQTFRPKEVIVVNDGSENDKEIRQCVASFETTDILYISQSNQGVASARNNGITHSNSKYICCLDADDWLESGFVERCLKELEANRSLGIAYTGLNAYTMDGNSTVSNWPGEFNPDKQLTYTRKQNQIPTACVFRKEAWERVGGYKNRYCPYGAGSEDAALWSAITSIGFNAKKVTEEALFNYTTFGGNVHNNKEYGEVDWLSMYPWAKDGLHPFASVATPKRWSHPVRQYDEPLISVIIPVGPGHEKEVENALDSLEMQTFRKWEVVIVWDYHIQKADNFDKAYPYVRQISTKDSFFAGLDMITVINENEAKNFGAGFCRNKGAEISRAPLLFFLDADDVLATSGALQKMLDYWNSQESIIYSDYLGKAQWNLEEAQKEFGDRLLGYNSKHGTAVFKKKALPFDAEKAQRQPEYSGNLNDPYYHWCLVSVLVPKAWHIEIGGFDESLSTWEDVDYHWRMARAGHCYFHVQDELIMYCYHKGSRREKSQVKDENSLHSYKSMIQYIKQKYEGLEIKVCNCGSKKKAVTVTAEASSSMNDGDFILIQFDFPGSETRSSYGQPLKSPTHQVDTSGRVLDYQGYSRRKGDRFLVHIQDQKARPNMFLPIPDEVKIPEMPKVELAEPKPLVESKEVVEPKKRGRKAKVVA